MKPTAHWLLIIPRIIRIRPVKKKRWLERGEGVGVILEVIDTTHIDIRGISHLAWGEPTPGGIYLILARITLRYVLYSNSAVTSGRIIYLILIENPTN